MGKVSRTIFVFFVCSMALSSCVIHGIFARISTIRHSDIKFEGGGIPIDSLLNINGFFTEDTIQPQKFFGHMFFANGTSLKISLEDKPIDEVRGNLSKSVVSWNSHGQKRISVLGGVYTLRGDTIIVHTYNSPWLYYPSIYMWETKYKIVDRNTIKNIHVYDGPFGNEPLHFVPCDSLPSSDTWLKEKKWMWRNKVDWQEYMRHVKEVKKQYKEQRKKK